ncbi:capsular polysaccharide biosynthesis protein [Campylobacter sp. MIT 19-121]|uniref:capsular polysaccharide biosynthesis protein n=1 Tax=Campylobacter sp. MIT 19-121 TaxID=2703906 RepID=UPI001389E8D8|nr:capsular polysaccharide biosynthesis protein [Campylobacter sp. MIT 19-121]NDJ26575.1 capsular polysaccharide biosynthesis protein [Campylobacter sp. MIT 19-121]
MKRYANSKRLINNVKSFLNLKPFILGAKVDKASVFYGWGRKNSGLWALKQAQKCKAKFELLEDGFLRSVGLGLEHSPSFSLVRDDVGIYYDATSPSRLENILNEYDFKQDENLLKIAQKSIQLIKKYELSKYNNALDLPADFFKKTKQKRILIITQSANDASLKYGLALQFSTQEMINDAIKENPNAQIYIKIHPDVLSKKKKADFDFDSLPPNCTLLKENFNPIALLKHFDKVYTKTSQMGFEALLCGCECVCYGLPFYAGWSLTTDKLVCARRKKKLTLEELFAGAYILYSEYFNPYSQEKSDILDTINSLYKYKTIEQINSNTLFFLGFSLWKRPFIKPFFKAKKNKLIFLNSLKKPINFKDNDKLFVWGASFSDEKIKEVFGERVRIFRVEDGFIRSVSLGSDLTRPFSLVVDSKGLYIDPSKESDLEYLLQNYEFNQSHIKRAQKVIAQIIKHKFSKYNNDFHKNIKFNAKKGQKILLIAAQVEDDASMLLGGFNLSTQELIKQARLENKDAYIVFKPHPDVLSGNRKGLKDEKIILEYCDEIICEASLHSCLDSVDEVHTITSTVGFEAILRAKKVVVYGLPFYAGWGLSTDKLVCARRKRKLSLEELVAGVLLIYPRYINAKDKELCEFEPAFKSLLELQNAYFSKKWLRFVLTLRNASLRKIRRVYECLFTKS